MTEGEYPEFVLVDGSPCTLSYALQPGEDADGVTLTVPATLLPRVDAARTDWLVPGFLVEKITELLRTLPKHVRRAVVPAPDWARAIADRIEFAQGSLIERLIDKLRELASIDVAPDDFQPRALPDHLRMNIRVVDQRQRVIAEGRDLDSLRAGAQEQVRQTIDELAAEQINADAITEWTFGELAESVQLTSRGGPVRVHPMLVDQGRDVSLRATECPVRARMENRRGIMRLAHLALKGELDAQIRMIPGLGTIAMHWKALGLSGDCRDELALRIVERCCLGDDPCDVRSAAAFERQINAGYGRVCEQALQVGQLLEGILIRAHEVELELQHDTPAQWRLALADIVHRRTTMLAPRFFTEAPWVWLEQMPRYLQSLRVRISKLGRGGWERDGKIMREFHPHQQPLDALLKRDALSLQRDPQAMAYRWMLEELHIVMFTQDLGTALPVSPKRMREQWQRVRQ